MAIHCLCQEIQSQFLRTSIHPSIQHETVPDGLTPTDMLLRETLSSSSAALIMLMMGTLVRTHALIRR